MNASVQCKDITEYSLEDECKKTDGKTSWGLHTTDILTAACRGTPTTKIR